MIGQTGIAKTKIFIKGKVFIHGELWDAKSNEKIAKGENVIVLKVEGLLLTVKKQSERSE